MKDIDPILKTILDGEKRAEAECIKYALRQVLKREPTDEDAKMCKRYQREGISGVYWLVFDGLVLGRIVKGEKSVTFEPRSDFSLDSTGGFI